MENEKGILKKLEKDNIILAKEEKESAYRTIKVKKIRIIPQKEVEEEYSVELLESRKSDLEANIKLPLDQMEEKISLN